METIGWKVIDEARAANRLKSLAQSRREPSYIRTAAGLGLGVHDLNTIRLKTVHI